MGKSDSFSAVYCEHCSGLCKPVYMECCGFTTSAARFVCPSCEQVTDIECNHCELCRFWKDCEMRTEPPAPRIYARATHCQFFGYFLHYSIVYGKRYERAGSLKEARRIAQEISAEVFSV